MTSVPTGEGGASEQAECQPQLQPQGDEERRMGGEQQSHILLANKPTLPQLCAAKLEKNSHCCFVYRVKLHGSCNQ